MEETPRASGSATTLLEQFVRTQSRPLAVGECTAGNGSGHKFVAQSIATPERELRSCKAPGSLHEKRQETRASGTGQSTALEIFNSRKRMKSTKSKSWFSRFAKATARASGRPAAFGVATSLVLVWIVTGPIFHFSDTWQLVINTGTTIITFLMVFLIQSTQNRDSEAMQVKLDELIRAVHGAQNALLDLEELEEDELDRIRARYAKLAEKARKGLHGDQV
jgi:low affinity Fe/Cu permease